MSDDVLFSALGDASLVRLGEIVMILELHRQGVSISAIARRVAPDRKTVRRYIAQGLEPPSYGPRQPRISQLRAFEPYLRQRLVAFPQLSGRRLHRELRDLGYSGGYSILTDLLRGDRPKGGGGQAARRNGRRAQRSATAWSRSSVPFTTEVRTFSIK